MQIEQNFDEKVLEELINHRINYFSFFEQNQETFEFDKMLANETTLKNFHQELESYSDHSNPYFDKHSYKTKEDYDNSIFPVFDTLTSLTSYEVKNSIQKDKAECSKVRD
jgi:ferric iron reductase protein FhuF